MILLFLLLKYYLFSMCSFLLLIKVILLYVYIRFIMVYHRILNIVPCAIQ